jgi:hypothetical protein
VPSGIGGMGGVDRTIGQALAIALGEPARGGAYALEC